MLQNRDEDKETVRDLLSDESVEKEEGDTFW